MRRDAVLVIDVEATCWKKNKTPKGEQSEIIEVGAVILDLTKLEPHSKRSMLVKPTRSKVSEFCTKLTGITPQMVVDGIPFAESCRVLQHEMKAKSMVWVSWGRYDHKMFTQQCDDLGVDYPFSDAHANAKEMYAHLYQLKKIGLTKAVEASGLELEGNHHRAADDAWNTAKVVAMLVKKFGVDIFLRYWM